MSDELEKALEYTGQFMQIIDWNSVNIVPVSVDTKLNIELDTDAQFDFINARQEQVKQQAQKIRGMDRIHKTMVKSNETARKKQYKRIEQLKTDNEQQTEQITALIELIDDTLKNAGIPHGMTFTVIQTTRNKIMKKEG